MKNNKNKKPELRNEVTELHDLYCKHLGNPADWNPSKTNAKIHVIQAMATALETYKKTLPVWDELAKASMENIYVWSDLHIGHANIIKMCGRPVTTLEEMDSLMLENAKATITDKDWLIFGGDVAMKNPPYLKRWLRECPGRKVLILGNHDVIRDMDWLKYNFEAVTSCWVRPLTDSERKHLGIADEKIDTLWFTHYPLTNTLIPENVLNVHGHLHEKLLDGRRLNISVEQQNLSPQRLDYRLKQFLVKSNVLQEKLKSTMKPF